jgi:hypothetical protein
MTHTHTPYTAELSTPREGSNPNQQLGPETAMISVADLPSPADTPMLRFALI